MKQFYLLAAALMATTSTFAQTAIWNGDGANTEWWGDGSPSVVENPDKSGINTSDNCLKFTMTNDNKVVKLKFSNTTDFSFNGSRRVSLMVKKTKNTNVNIELSDPTDGSNGYWQKAAAWYGGEGAWQKLVFDFSTHSINDYAGLISITASTDNVEEAEDVYIDNIVVEDVAKVDGVALNAIEDGSLSGAIMLTGAWMKGDCQNTNGDWQRVDYNDFDLLAKKLSATTTSIDLRGTVLKDAYNAFDGVNPNILVYADETFGENNVIVNGSTAALNLNEDYAFHAPEAFTATSITLTHAVYEGYNSVCLPFVTTASELNGTDAAVYASTETSSDKTVVKFTKQDNIAAYTPFVLIGATASETQTFTDKQVATTPESLGTPFVGTLQPVSGEGKWGLTANQTFAKGGTNATLKAFHAYLDLGASEAKHVSFELDDATAINAAAIDHNNTSLEVYNLQGVKQTSSQLAKGIYIINGKKMVVR